jgi:hypothetical protein
MSSQVANIHDAFFKQVLSDQQAAGTFLREHLPPEVTGLLTCDPPERVPGSFVDEELCWWTWAALPTSAYLPSPACVLT